MSKKLKVLVAVLTAVVLLTVGGAAAVLADDETTSTSNVTSTNNLLARVADKLGIAEEELANAFSEAQQEMREEAFTSYLDKAVEEGLITQEEANEIEEWQEQRPEAFNSLSPRQFGSGGLLNRNMWGAQRGWSEESLNQAMERGLTAEGTVNQFMERWQKRLASPKQMFAPEHIRQAMRNRQMMTPTDVDTL